jgi:probable rRNA maturation factor
MTDSRLSLAVQYASVAPGVPARYQFRRWCKIALQRDVIVTLRVVDETEGRSLNRGYRGKDYATNVLTFVYDDAQPLCGDVVICAPVVVQEAAQQGKELVAHYAHLTLHAMLHLQGYDHILDVEAAHMEALESALMLKLRYPDPYQQA